MPVIIVKARQGVIKTKEKKAELIADVSQAFARAAGDPGYVERIHVIIEEVPNENWGRGGKQVQG